MSIAPVCISRRTAFLSGKSRGTLNVGETFYKLLAPKSRATTRKTHFPSPVASTAFNSSSTGTAGGSSRYSGRKKAPKTPCRRNTSPRRASLACVQEASFAQLIDSTVKEFGKLDGLFNVASDLSAQNIGRDTDVITVGLDVWQHTMDVTLTGYMYGRPACSAVRPRRDGSELSKAEAAPSRILKQERLLEHPHAEHGLYRPPPSCADGCPPAATSAPVRLTRSTPC